MGKLKTALLSIGMSMVVGVSVFAQVQEATEMRTNWSLKYPVVTVEGNPAAQAAINADLMERVDHVRADFQSGQYYTAGGWYEVNYEDDSLLSITMALYGYPHGANGNHVWNYAVVYDKNTGNRIPLEHFVRGTIDDLNSLALFSLDSDSGERVKAQSRVDRVPAMYFLEGDGVICVQFRAYELAAGVYGSTYVRIDREHADYFNRKNQ